MEKAVLDFLQAAGLNLSDPDLQGTPARVRQLWERSFLGGYRLDPAQILQDTVPAEGENDLVILRDLPCHGMCPHHLMPWVGRASVAYLPDEKLLGFGKIQELVACCSQRLTLQERVTHDIADALMTHLQAKGAACTVVAQHLCLSIPDDKHEARVHTQALRGVFRARTDLQLQLAQTR